MTAAILDEIVLYKRKELAEAKKKRSEAEVRRAASAAPATRGFRRALESAPVPVAVIAEIKRRSPSKGVLADGANPAQVARAYEAAGASALSVLTDEKYFGGSADALVAARNACRIPVLRKDFTLDEYHVYEARAMGADAVLLIVSILSDAELSGLSKLAGSLGMDALVEIHGEEEARRALAAGATFVGINNRDLQTFRVDLKTSGRLAPLFRGRALLVGESGIQKTEDLLYLRDCGARAALVGESLMKEGDPGAALRRLLGRS